MPSVIATKLKKGDFIKHNDDIWVILQSEHHKPGKGVTIMRIRMRQISTGKSVDHTFKASDDVETVEVTTTEMQFLYREGDKLFFMDNDTFEQYELAADWVGESAKFLKDGNTYLVYMHENNPIDINLGGSVDFKVIAADEVVKGNTATNVKKEVTLENGTKAFVPAFIKVGDIVSINPDTAEYRGRVNE